jgi:two-component system phosphate regulon sensor histidine kinase PhoR
LEKVTSRVVELLTPAAQKKNHKLVLQAADDLRPVIGNPEYLERAVLNLVDNAIKYTRENGTIKVVARTENGSSIVEVIDNGIGIASEEVPRIFERFYRVDRSRSRDMGGTGLGLSIVKHIVAAHGGTVEVTSSPETGSTFRLRFPAVREESRGETDANGAAA